MQLLFLIFTGKSFWFCN